MDFEKLLCGSSGPIEEISNTIRTIAEYTHPLNIRGAVENTIKICVLVEDSSVLYRNESSLLIYRFFASRYDGLFEFTTLNIDISDEELVQKMNKHADDGFCIFTSIGVSGIVKRLSDLFFEDTPSCMLIAFFSTSTALMNNKNNVYRFAIPDSMNINVVLDAEKAADKILVIYDKDNGTWTEGITNSIKNYTFKDVTYEKIEMNDLDKLGELATIDVAPEVVVLICSSYNPDMLRKLHDSKFGKIYDLYGTVGDSLSANDLRLVNNGDISVSMLEGYYDNGYEEYVRLKNTYPTQKFSVYCGLISPALMWLACLVKLKKYKTIKQINDSNAVSFNFAKFDSFGDNLAKQWLIKPIVKHDVKLNSVFRYEIDIYTSTVYFTVMNTEKIRSFEFLEM
jgi:hypothetical protein